MHIDLARGEGQLRYRYFGQDVLYRLGQISADGARIHGTGEFQSSVTGEIQGSPFEFDFDYLKNRLHDGAATFQCEALQDPSLIHPTASY